MRSVGRCQAFKSCRRKAVYCSPGQWCNKHWSMWWNYAMKHKPDLLYMRRDGSAELERLDRHIEDRIDRSKT